MEGHFLTPVRALGPQPTMLSGSFAVNGVSNPDPTQTRYQIGAKPTVTHTGTGTYTVAFPQGVGSPAQVAQVSCNAQCDVLADWFDCIVIGETQMNTANRSFVVTTHKAGVATDIAAAAGSRVNFIIFFDNSTGAG